MSKRQGDELNHTNWNEETEHEEAGSFPQASTGAMRGRVIKTARRRRPLPTDTDQANSDTTANKPTFAGFGGFGSGAPADAKAVFNFIGKTAESEKGSVSDKPAPAASGGFVFGSPANKPTESGAASSPFSFGGFSSASKPTFSDSSEATTKKAAPVFGNFGGTTENVESKASSLGGTKTDTKAEASTFGGFSFGSKTAEEKEKPSETSKSDLMSSFKPSPGWSCPTCMINNPVDKVACLACETPKPGSKPEEKKVPAFGAGGGFSFGSAQNSSPSGFSFGAKQNNSEEDKENKTSSGFTFGAKSPATEKPSIGGFLFESKSDKSKEGFSFGGKASDKTNVGESFKFGAETEESNNKAPAESFSFGAKASESTRKSIEPFSFGSKPVGSSNNQSSDENFSFGTKTVQETKTNSFSFGSKSENKEQSSSESDAKKTILSGFGSKEGGAFNFGASNAICTSGGNTHSNTSWTPPAEENSGSGSSGAKSQEQQQGMIETPSEQYLAHLKALNTQVAAWINQHLQQNPLVLLTPVFKDYDKHLAEITTKYRTENVTKKTESDSIGRIGSSIGGAPASSSPSVPKSSAAVSDPPKTSIMPFGTFASSDKPTVSTAPFSFGASSNTLASSSTPAFGGFGASSTATGGFSFGLSGSTTTPAPPKEAEAAEEDPEDTPPVVEVKQVTEDDAKYSKRCKLFYKKDENYVEKGVGMLYLKTVEGGKTQLLIRADTNLGNVLLNILLNPSIPTTKAKNNVMMVCVPNPPVDPKADSAAPCTMLIRVKGEDGAEELKAKIDEYKGK